MTLSSLNPMPACVWHTLQAEISAGIDVVTLQLLLQSDIRHMGPSTSPAVGQCERLHDLAFHAMCGQHMGWSDGHPGN